MLLAVMSPVMLPLSPAKVPGSTFVKFAVGTPDIVKLVTTPLGPEPTAFRTSVNVSAAFPPFTELPG